MQLFQTGVMVRPFDTAAADTIRALSLLRHMSQRLTAVMIQAHNVREHSVTQYNDEP